MLLVQSSRPTDQHLLAVAVLKVVLQEPAHQATVRCDVHTSRTQPKPHLPE